MLELLITYLLSLYHLRRSLADLWDLVRLQADASLLVEVRLVLFIPRPEVREDLVDDLIQRPVGYDLLAELALRRAGRALRTLLRSHQVLREAASAESVQAVSRPCVSRHWEATTTGLSLINCALYSPLNHRVRIQEKPTTQAADQMPVEVARLELDAVPNPS